MMILKVLIFSIFAVCSGKPTDSELVNCFEREVRGYYIKRFKKIEFEEIAKNKKLKEEGRSFETAIDYSEQSFFIPSDSVENICLSDLLKRDSTFFGEYFVYLPSKRTKKFIKKYCGKEIEVDTLWNSNASKLFALKERSHYLYDIVYIEGKSIYSQVANNRSNRIYLKVIYRLKESRKFIDCYFIHSVSKTSSIISDKGLVEWSY